MKNRRRRVTIAVLLLVIIAASMVFIASSRRPLPKVKVDLWDASHMTLVDADRGRYLCYGGGPNEKLLSKLLGHDLPAMFHNRPSVIQSSYTNGMGLLFRREETGLLTGWWNGSGRLFLVEHNGRERVGLLRAVNFNVDEGAKRPSSEDLSFDFPFVAEQHLHFRLYETNSRTGAVTTNDFQMPNPVL